MHRVRKVIACALLPLLLLSTMVTGLLAFAVAKIAKTE